MRASKFTPEQMVHIVRQDDSGVPVRKAGVLPNPLLLAVAVNIPPDLPHSEFKREKPQSTQGLENEPCWTRTSDPLFKRRFRYNRSIKHERHLSLCREGFVLSTESVVLIDVHPCSRAYRYKNRHQTDRGPMTPRVPR